MERDESNLPLDTDRQPLHGRARLHAQFVLNDLRLKTKGREQLFDIGPGMTVTAVQLKAETGINDVCGRMLERKHQHSLWTQRSCERSNDVLQIAKIYKRVR